MRALVSEVHRLARKLPVVAPALVGTLAAVAVLSVGPFAASAGAAAGPEGLQWRLEQPEPPAQSGESCQPTPTTRCRTPIGLGRIGDIEFSAPNRGLLITDGNGSTVPPGVWSYNGQGWHELANVCGATDGRIAWAGEDEFWTISDGRPGQVAQANGVLPSLEDDTLCHFAQSEPANPASPLEVVKSYASLAFQASSYQAMHAAACIDPNDCWFAGEPLPKPQIGAFHLHWNGSSLEPEPNTQVETVDDMRVFHGSLYESIGLPLEESGEIEHTIEEILHPSVLQEVAAEGVSPTFGMLHPRSSTNQILPEYGSGSAPQALGFLHLSADEDSLWAAAGPVAKPPSGSEPGALTVLNDSNGTWSQVLGPEVPETVKPDPPGLAEDVVNSIAAEPASSSAWLALDSREDAERPNPTEVATVAHVSSDGSISEEQVPSEVEGREGVGPKGAAYRIACPAQNDCWMATTEGWLFHLSEADSRTLPADTDPAFNGPLIAYRPHDEGLPQETLDTLPVDDSGLEESQGPSAAASIFKVTPVNTFAEVELPLLSHERTRIIHGTTLDLTFHLAVKARIRLIAKRHKSVVASTSMQTLKAGNRSLEVKLDRDRWPTKLELQTHALAPLPRTSTRGAGVESVETSAVFSNDLGVRGWGPTL
jgi:hypothetical protein